MCNCFGRSDKKNEQEEEEEEDADAKKSSPAVKDKKKAKPRTQAEPTEKSQTRSANQQIFSSPSQMKTTDLTDVYQVPSPLYSTADEVVSANGFELGEMIGKGSYAVVYRARRKADKLDLACKIMEVSPKPGAFISAKNELFILERIQHPHIVRLYKHFVVELKATKTRQVYIFMQLAEKNNLSSVMRKGKTGMPEEKAKRLFAQMVCAVNHMHQKNIAHRDLKMGNILFNSKGDCLVADFGLSRVVYRASKGGTIMSNKYCGTLPYMAPEILLAKDHEVEYNPFMADIWALGVLLHCMVNLGYPFVECDTMLEDQMRHKITWGKRMAFKPDEHLYDLLYQLLHPNVSKRIKMDKLLVHPWIAEQIKEVESAIQETNSSSPSIEKTTPSNSH